MIIVTGSNGQLGSSLKNCLTGMETSFLSRQDLDIGNFDQVQSVFQKLSPTWIINCAAYTAVDACETNKEDCFRVNADGAKNLSIAAKEFGAKLIHISTDYVFNGNENTPIKEDAPTDPQSQYGHSKLAGEVEVQSNTAQNFIIRTSWLYDNVGANFLNTMRRLISDRDSLGVVYDQVGTPTFVPDLAQGIKQIISKNSDKYGVYHFSNLGVCSWYDFASSIKSFMKNETCNISPIRSSEYPTPAKRPTYSVLDTSKFRNEFDFTIPHWQESLAKCFKN